MRRVAVLTLLILVVALPAAPQGLDRYLETSQQLRKQVESLASATTRDEGAIRDILPFSQGAAFVEFVSAAPSFRRVLAEVDAERLNKMLAGTPGASGTALVSHVAAPAVLAAAVEYGSILQQTSGTTTTLRGNVLGIARFAVGSEQFAYCAPVANTTCSSTARQLRRLSASVSFQDRRPAAAQAAGAAPAAGTLLGADYRVTAWAARLDLTPSNNLDHPSYSRDWSAAITALQKDPAAPVLSKALTGLINDKAGPVYDPWTERTVARLQEAATPQAFYDELETALTTLVAELQQADPQFASNIGALRRAYATYFNVRDGLLQRAQSNKASLEFTSRRPGDQPNSSNLRLIYSHQPTRMPSVVTVNASLSWYNNQLEGTSSRLRDLQVAGQLDRRLGNVGSFGPATLTLAGYVQWMKDDAVILIGEGTAAPGTTIELPGPAARLLNTKGTVGVFQARISVAMTPAVRIPISVTWANRNELIKERDVRGQIGLTFDVDQLLH